MPGLQLAGLWIWLDKAGFEGCTSVAEAVIEPWKRSAGPCKDRSKLSPSASGCNSSTPCAKVQVCKGRTETGQGELWIRFRLGLFAPSLQVPVVAQPQ